MSNQGYGICGAKNIYSSRVKLDNWVEDEFGATVASSVRPKVTYFKTVQMESHCHPSQWPEPNKLPANMPTTLELITKNKEGMPYSLLFGSQNIPLDERFKTVGKKALEDGIKNKFTSLPEGYIENEKLKKIRRDVNLATYMTTELRAANSHRIEGSDRPLKAIGPVEPLPDWRRNSTISRPLR